MSECLRRPSPISGRAVAVAPRSAVPVVRQADTYLRSGDLVEAQERFEAALNLDPTNGEALLGLARAYSLAGGGTSAVEFGKAEARLKEISALVAAK